MKAMVLRQNAVFEGFFSELSIPVLVSTKTEVLALYCDS